MGRSITFAPNEYYHVYNRGTEKRKIFLDVTDYERFLLLMYLTNSPENVHLWNERGRTSLKLLSEKRDETLVDICCYCLMPNHVHLLLREKTSDGISRFMQKLMTGYTMYFNTRRDRTGALFQGRYKAEHAADDVYLKYLISYIHLNPIKLIEPDWKEKGISKHSQAEKYLQKYRWSSFPDYYGIKRPENNIINTASLPDYFENSGNFKAAVTEWLDFPVEK
jgi:putative transposase